MDDLLPPIPPPKGNIPANKPPSTDDIEVGIYSVATAVLAVSQYYSKSYPHTAGKISEFMLGPEIVGVKKFPRISPTNAGLFFAPPPVGFISPRRFGLEPNYVFEVESRLKSHGLGLEKLLPPPTHFLHNLPDNDPRVAVEKLEYQAREQQLLVRDLGRTATVDELFGLYFAARGPDANKHFVNPKEIEEELKAQIEMKLYGPNGFRIEKVRREIDIAALNLPAKGTQPTSIPSPFDEPPRATNAFGITPLTTSELFARLEAEGAKRPLDAPPVGALQQAAFAIAPDVVKQLATERADP